MGSVSGQVELGSVSGTGGVGECEEQVELGSVSGTGGVGSEWNRWSWSV